MIPPVTLLLSIFANDVLPIFIVAAVGFAVARVLGADVRTVSRITFNALSPCLVFHLIVTSSLGRRRLRPDDGADVRGHRGDRSAGARGRRCRSASTARRSAPFLLVVMFSNSGNYGLPVVLFAFGKEALAHAAVYFVANAVADLLARRVHRVGGTEEPGAGAAGRGAGAGGLGRGGGRCVIGARRHAAAAPDAAGRTAGRRGAAGDDPRPRDAAGADGRPDRPGLVLAGGRAHAGRHARSSPWARATSSA